MLGALHFVGCATKTPPSLSEIRKQSDTLNKLPLKEPWKAGGISGSVKDNWLQSFNDAELAALVKEAMADNPDLRIAATKVEQAAQYVELAKAALRPTVNLLGIGGINLGGGDVSSALQGASLGVSWEPDLWGRMRYGRNAYEATYASAQADFEFGRQSLAAAIARIWFTAGETELQLQIAEEMITDSGELVSLAETRFRLGPGNEKDVVLARAQMDAFEDTAAKARLALSQIQRALELLLGRYPGAALKARKDLPALPGPIPAGLPLEMLERRPDLIAAERRIAAAFHRIGESKAARLPRIVLNANVGVLKSDILELKSDFENPTVGAGGRINIPIYQGGAMNTQVTIRTIEQKQAVAEYAAMVLRALGDVENTLAAAQNLEERYEILQRTVADNQRALDLLQLSYDVGRADLRELLQQQLALSAAKLALLRVQREQLTARVDLHLALGGSFEKPKQQPPASEKKDTSSLKKKK
jgi:NodT family efflux transporter outer membrane factor (OMF) lipoprotein